MTEHGLDGLTFGHFGDGCVHIRIDFPFSTEPGRYRQFAVAAAQLVGKYGGSMSGEHGDGRARGELLPAMYSPEAIETMAAVKAIFDPGNVFNPGVLVDPAPLDADLRVPQARPLRTGLGFAYPHDAGDLSTAVHRCVGVGKCRADTTAAAGDVPVVPGHERREGLHPGPGAGPAGTRERRAGRELPLGRAGRIAGPVLVVQGLLVGLPGRGRHGDLQGRGAVPAVPAPAAAACPLLARLAAPLGPAGLPRARTGERRARTPFLADLAKRLGGIDARRLLPQFAAQSFRQWFARHPAQAGPVVLLWVDTFTDYFTPEVGQAAVRVLEAAGYAVEITSQPVCCGLTWISTGQLDGARRQLRRSLDALSPPSRLAPPSSGWNPLAPPSCAARSRSCCPRTARPSGALRHPHAR